MTKAFNEIENVCAVRKNHTVNKCRLIETEITLTSVSLERMLHLTGYEQFVSNLGQY